MRKKILLAAALIVVLAIISILTIMVHAAKAMSLSDRADWLIQNVAICIEVYRDENGKYPASLKDLASEDFSRKLMDEIAKYHSALKIDYQSSSNGFSLAVSGIDSWYPSRDRKEKAFKIGEAHHQCDWK